MASPSAGIAAFPRELDLLNLPEQRPRITSVAPWQRQGQVHKDIQAIDGVRVLTLYPGRLGTSRASHYHPPHNATMSSSGPPLPGVARAHRDFRTKFAAIRTRDGRFNYMLKTIAFYAKPPATAVKSDDAPAPHTLSRLVALLCLYAMGVAEAEKRNIILFINSERLYSVASYTLSDNRLQVDPAQRQDIMRKFNALMARVLYGFAIWCFSWNAKPNPNIPAKDAAEELYNRALVAPNNSDVEWTFLVFVFGLIPEFWGLRPSNSSLRSTAEPSGALVKGKAKAPEISDAAAVNRGVLGSSPSLPRPFSNPVYDIHLGANLSLPNLRFGITNRATSSDEGAIRNTVATRPDAPIFKARNSGSTASTPAAIQSTLPECVATLLQDGDLTSFLSRFGIIPPTLDSELSALLHGAPEFEEFKAEDDEALGNAKARVQNRLNEFRQVHEEYVDKMWNLARHARQWHTWGLEMRYSHEKQGVILPPDVLSQQHELFTFLNGFAILTLRLRHQQAAFQPSEA